MCASVPTWIPSDGDQACPAALVDRACDDVQDSRAGHEQERERRDDEEADGGRVRDHAFNSQTSRSPSSVRNGSICSMVSECGATRSARPPVAIARASAPSSPRIRANDPVDLARKAVDETGLQPGDGRLPDDGRRGCVVDLHEARRAGEQSIHRDLDSRREDTADVFARGRDDVEVRRRPEVDHDHGSAVAFLGRNRIHDPVGSDLAGIVVLDRDPRLDARPDDEERCVGPLRGEQLPLTHENRHRRC